MTLEAGDAEHWEELQALFERFEHTPAGELQDALTAACPDAGLRRRVSQLLSAARAVALEARPAPNKPAVERFVGPYRLLREIGTGGIGVVYLAERVVNGATLRSALKVLAPHAVDGSFVERFYREQQILAALDHPNITRLLDAGWTEDGKPYLGMEYVEGRHLDEYCDAQRLNIDARLRLFLQICDAVSNAHRNLIVHLDLKPSNVLVTAAGAVKLLDFGTSKLIQIDGGPTSTLMATPAYASPEQLLNEPVTTASDVYGLGSVLYELLAGRAPFGKVSAAIRMEASLREVEPESLTRAVTSDAALRRGSTLARLSQTLQGDLAAIVATCLRSRPRDRYASVDALREDLGRYLANMPVLVRNHTLIYKAGKFLRRHRLAVSVAGLLTLTVAASVGYAWRQQQTALREAERSVRMQTLLFSLFKMANPNYTGKPVATVPEFLRAAMDRLPDAIHDATDLRVAQLGLAESLYQSGDLPAARAGFGRVIDSASAAGALAGKAEAEAYAGDAERHLGHLVDGRTLGAQAMRDAAAPGVPVRVRVITQVLYASNEDGSGFRTDGNLHLLRSAVAEARRHHLDAPVLALALNALGEDLDLRGADAEAQDIFRELLAQYSSNPAALCDRSATYGWLAWIADKGGDPAASVPLYRQAYEGYVTCAGADSRGALEELPYFADGLIKTGHAADAVRMLEEALPTWRRVEGDNPDGLSMLFYLARGYSATERYPDAERVSRELLTQLDGKAAPEDRIFGMAQLVLAQALCGEHRYAEALPHATAAAQLLSREVSSVYGQMMRSEALDLKNQVQAALAGPVPGPQKYAE